MDNSNKINYELLLFSFWDTMVVGMSKGQGKAGRGIVANLHEECGAQWYRLVFPRLSFPEPPVWKVSL